MVQLICTNSQLCSQYLIVMQVGIYYLYAAFLRFFPFPQTARASSVPDPVPASYVNAVPDLYPALKMNANPDPGEILPNFV
jgi:hypothetical protein